MKFENSDLETTFEVADRPTIRQTLAYDGAVEMRIGMTTFERLWAGVQAMVKPGDWHSPVSLSVDLDSVDEQQAIQVIKWAGLALFSHMLTLRNVEKN